jgi:signal transduction histidine kinase
MRRLYLQIYVTIVGVLLLFGFLVGILWFMLPTHPQDRRTLDGLGVILGQLLPGADQSTDTLQAALQRLGTLFPADITVRGSDGTLLAAIGNPLPSVPSGRTHSGWMHARRGRPMVALVLPDSRWVVVSWQRRPRVLGWPVLIGLLAVAIALGAYPVVRRVTRRLERLQRQVEALGAGNFATRVEVSGTDEVAQLAHSFNHAADRIERLINAQRTILAGASHEFRSPLARMRVAIELWSRDERPELRTRLAQDIAELDTLIGELLLASRLDTLDHLEHMEDVDLLALLAEEGARTGAEVSGTPVCIQGDPRMLRRLIRNLLENARRYAVGSAVEATVVPLPTGGARLCVADQGPGVPEQERERIFEPFYRASNRREPSDVGVGLGLALVRQIARHHDGDVRCLPRASGGTCFEVTLRVPQT